MKKYCTALVASENTLASIDRLGRGPLLEMDSGLAFTVGVSHRY